jgi:hypothetical protein
MKNIICIDVTMYNNEKLIQIAKELNIDSKMLITNKERGFAKIYILNGQGIAYTQKIDPTIGYTSCLDEMLKAIKPFEAKKKAPKEMTIDTILDKINLYGIESLSVTEKKFLDENSN